MIRPHQGTRGIDTGAGCAQAHGEEPVSGLAGQARPSQNTPVSTSRIGGEDEVGRRVRRSAQAACQASVRQLGDADTRVRRSRPRGAESGDAGVGVTCCGGQRACRRGGLRDGEIAGPRDQSAHGAIAGADGQGLTGKDLRLRKDVASQQTDGLGIDDPKLGRTGEHAVAPIAIDCHCLSVGDGTTTGELKDTVVDVGAAGVSVHPGKTPGPRALLVDTRGLGCAGVGDGSVDRIGERIGSIQHHHARTSRAERKGVIQVHLLGAVVDELHARRIGRRDIRHGPGDVREVRSARVRVVEDHRADGAARSQGIGALAVSGIGELVSRTKHIISAAVEIIVAQLERAGDRKVAGDARGLHARLEVAGKLQHADSDGHPAGKVIPGVGQLPSPGDAETIVVTRGGHAEADDIGSLGDRAGDPVHDRVEVTAGLTRKRECLIAHAGVSDVAGKGEAAGAVRGDSDRSGGPGEIKVLGERLPRTYVFDVCRACVTGGSEIDGGEGT